MYHTCACLHSYQSFPQFFDEMPKLGQGCFFQNRQNPTGTEKEDFPDFGLVSEYSSYNPKHLHHLEAKKEVHNLCLQNHLADVKLLSTPIYIREKLSFNTQIFLNPIIC